MSGLVCLLNLVVVNSWCMSESSALVAEAGWDET